MLIDQKEIENILANANIPISGVLHIGAHDCEELGVYSRLGVSPNNIIWIDAISEKVEQAKARGIPNVYRAVITDKDDAVVTFNVSNNVQSSSILNLKTHLQEHPWVHYVRSTQETTITVDTFFKRNNLDPTKHTFWNLDIQGAELLALMGATESLAHAKALYLEVNINELYENCALMGQLDTFLSKHGFKRVKTHMTQHGWGDAMYIKQSS
jgi:FkbM family methyltransferase